jgi:uncharacterized protein YndB with AHSA1/START domain
MAAPANTDSRELVLVRTFDAPPELVYRAWTEPELIKPWFCPKPWYVSHAETDVRAGGASYIVMNGPNGEVHHNRGVYLEVIPHKKLVFTDAYTGDWQPSQKPFFTCVLTFENQGGKTLYTARARHWTQEDTDTHKNMGFEQGWNAASDQLVTFLAQLQSA